MIIVSFAHKETGIFNGAHLTTNDPVVVGLNTPKNHAVVAGHHDALSKIFDHQTGLVMEYQPSQPSTDHEWDSNAKRWQLSTTAAARVLEAELAAQHIAELTQQQHALIRRLALKPTDAAAREALAALDVEIAGLTADGT